MTQNVNAEIISIGTEILLGELTDTNSVFIARALRDIGVNVYFMTSVGDNRERIAQAIQLALSRAHIVITCGGLGPTVDDMTRAGVAAAMGRELVFQQALLEAIAARFASYKVEMTENNRQQAYLPQGATVIENPVGTAPSFAVEDEDRSVISLPGVPREMKFLMRERVIPYLRERYNVQERVIQARILKTAGVGESYLDTLLGKDLLEASNPTIGLAAHSGQIDIRITAKADTRDEAGQLIDAFDRQVRERAGDYIFGADDDKLEEVFATLLASNNASLAISETGTQGVIAERLFAAFQFESLIAGQELFESPVELCVALGLPEQVPLKDIAEAAAKRLRSQTGATVSIAVVSRPEVNENPDIDAGTAVVVATDKQIRHRVYGFGGQSDDVSRFVGNWSTAIAWRMVKEWTDGL